MIIQKKLERKYTKGKTSMNLFIGRISFS